MSECFYIRPIGDNLSIFILIFSLLGINSENQPKLLLLGILISIILRIVFILVGVKWTDFDVHEPKFFTKMDGKRHITNMFLAGSHRLYTDNLYPVSHLANKGEVKLEAEREE
ncbi:MAG: hypothetical protein QM237_02940 [Bacteroidota bacterium]|jgi:hypothetical protein|nr:hypothetical protein [Bacteroidota bacterium]HHU95917.1 hypothetical protein [Petrimonas sp.]